jgi:hypothetical protein
MMRRKLCLVCVVTSLVVVAEIMSFGQAIPPCDYGCFYSDCVKLSTSSYRYYEWDCSVNPGSQTAHDGENTFVIPGMSTAASGTVRYWNDYGGMAVFACQPDSPSSFPVNMHNCEPPEEEPDGTISCRSCPSH